MMLKTHVKTLSSKRRARPAKSAKDLPRVRSFGKIEFWWDLHHKRNAIMVECDDPQYAVIRVLVFKNALHRKKCEAIAKRLIERIKANRVDYRVLATRVPKWAQWTRDYATLFEHRTKTTGEEW